MENTSGVRDYEGGWSFSRTNHWCASLFTAINKKLVTFLFWIAIKTNHITKCSDFQKKLIDTITTSNFYLNFKEKNENDMAAKLFGLFVIPADGGAKSAQLLTSVLPFYPLYFPWFVKPKLILHNRSHASRFNWQWLFTKAKQQIIISSPPTITPMIRAFVKSNNRTR